MNIKLSIILPCYNEEQNILHIYKEILDINFNKNEIFEIIFVENGSTDNTEKEIKSVIDNNNSKKNNILFKVVKLTKNVGYGGGIKKGLESANGEFIGWAHADLQSPLEDLYKLYRLMNNDKNSFGKGKRINNRGYDGVVSRFHEKCASLILGQRMREINAQPKIFHRSVIKYFKKIPTDWTVIDTYVYYISLKEKINIYEINVIFRNRIYGHSKWKNNYKIFFMHLFFNFIYLFKLKFFDSR